MKFSRTVFSIAGIWGILVLAPLYVAFDFIGRQYPPAITHPELYYGFVGVALAWQFAFLIIARDPVRFRPLMVAAMLEKFIYVASLAALYAQGRLHAGQAVVGIPDFVLGLLFVAAFRAASPAASTASDGLHQARPDYPRI